MGYLTARYPRGGPRKHGHNRHSSQGQTPRLEDERAHKNPTENNDRKRPMSRSNTTTCGGRVALLCRLVPGKPIYTVTSPSYGCTAAAVNRVWVKHHDSKTRGLTKPKMRTMTASVPCHGSNTSTCDGRVALLCRLVPGKPICTVQALVPGKPIYTVAH